MVIFAAGVLFGLSPLVCICFEWPLLLFGCWLPWFTVKDHARRGIRAHIIWGSFVVMMTLGEWCVYNFIGIIYVGLLAAERELLASWFLPAATAFAELAFVNLTSVVYSLIVLRLRRRDLSSSVCGDQKRFAFPLRVWQFDRGWKCAVIRKHLFLKWHPLPPDRAYGGFLLPQLGPLVMRKPEYLGDKLAGMGYWDTLSLRVSRHSYQAQGPARRRGPPLLSRLPWQ